MFPQQKPLSAKEFSTLDFKTGAQTFNKSTKRSSVPLSTKPFVQLQGMAEAIRIFDGTPKSSHSISFYVNPDDEFDVFATKMKAMSTEIYSDKSGRLNDILSGFDYRDVEHKDYVKERDGLLRTTFYLHPTFTKYFIYDRDTKKKTPVDLLAMKKKPMGFYSVIVKVDHLDIANDEKTSKIVCGMVAYVHSLCYIVPREKGLKDAQGEPDFDLACFAALGGGAKAPGSGTNSKKRKLS
jgi:hypothetical protein